MPWYEVTVEVTETRKEKVNVLASYHDIAMEMAEEALEDEHEGKDIEFQAMDAVEIDPGEIEP